MNLASRMIRNTAAALALAGALAPARADVVLMGSDYFETIQPTFFLPLGGLNPLGGLPIGPGTTDTIVQRRTDCMISLGSLGSQCTIPIEMVALSLVSLVNPAVLLRESPTLQSAGQMTITSDGSGTGGTFSSFFDVFFEISLDGGSTFLPQGPIHLDSSGTPWSTQPGGLLVPGPVGDQDANLHLNRNDCPGIYNGMPCFDFYVEQVTESHPRLGTHTARSAIPEPGSLALAGLALVLAGWSRRRRID